jgi:hypothetical protein
VVGECLFRIYNKGDVLKLIYTNIVFFCMQAIIKNGWAVEGGVMIRGGYR